MMDAFGGARPVSKPASDCNDPVFVQLSNIELGEAPPTGQVVLRLFQALVLEECIDNRLGIAWIIRHLVHLSSFHGSHLSPRRRLRCFPQTGLI
jgi:hypothetical protein